MTAVGVEHMFERTRERLVRGPRPRKDSAAIPSQLSRRKAGTSAHRVQPILKRPARLTFCTARAHVGPLPEVFLNLSNPTFARYPAVSRQDPAFDRLGQRQTAVAAGEKAARSRRSRATNAELGRFAPSYAHLPCRLLTAQHPCDAHAGAGGARSWAINDRMSANICLDTATSAIWKVT